MGCGGSKEQVLPAHAKNDGLLSVPPGTSPGTSVAQTSNASLSTTNGVGPASTKLNQGTHWAEASPGKDRREAEKPWEPKRKYFEHKHCNDARRHGAALLL